MGERQATFSSANEDRIAALGRDPFRDGYVPIIETRWKASPGRQCYCDLSICNRRCERQKIRTSVVSVRPH
jgi:hypothetical protein